ncbi:uncharacterized protein FFB20_04808 [Fusarium fujikuroi]|uniref:Uncharacterized protein n=2 Tax=Fusarium fujikuroi TaxID=5127 RepID=S0DZB6_GIBF5|nr:uncharacterized protein FFUJ_02800 [Fusarium fujikuroi IMI 58289]KLO80052.1 uncharacterized protein LW93_7498 [Fusarium fujikuroi]KLP02183.1 uncharacterized protein Y057_2342 [Fusarium fujikuroi]KLP16009.1 uncharacterized protein LW94_7969 [Fusarium fujikuroi]QGI62001.1 hypothetical protein CEK27_005972 [Fusarium fujikuroi]QGI79177.1 hypothetical protein CEK25_005906 [Fusarium fujikuroi]
MAYDGVETMSVLGIPRAGLGSSDWFLLLSLVKSSPLREKAFRRGCWTTEEPPLERPCALSRPLLIRRPNMKFMATRIHVRSEA